MLSHAAGIVCKPSFSFFKDKKKNWFATIKTSVLNALKLQVIKWRYWLLDSVTVLSVKLLLTLTGRQQEQVSVLTFAIRSQIKYQKCQHRFSIGMENWTFNSRQPETKTFVLLLCYYYYWQAAWCALAYVRIRFGLCNEHHDKNKCVFFC